MAAPQEAFLWDDAFSATDWKESILESRTDTVSRDKSLCHITIICPFAKYKAAVTYILGYAWVDEAKKLRREVPVFHPTWPWLYARAVTNISFSSATGKETGPWKDAIPFATYVWAKIEIEFESVPYTIKSDGATTYEYERYVEQKPMPYVELLQISGGQLKAYAPSVTGVDGKPYVAAPYIMARQEKSRFDLIWREVPAEFLYDSNGFAKKIAGIQKKVNSATFLGRIAGTLLCEDVKADKTVSPVATDVNEELSFSYDVTLCLKEFNPDRGDTAVDKYGWNLLPGQKSTGSSGNTAFRYYYFTDDGTLTGKPQFASYDFATFFTHHSL
jgi:hypothetical protein